VQFADHVYPNSNFYKDIGLKSFFSRFDTIPACDRHTPNYPANHVAVAKTALT